MNIKSSICGIQHTCIIFSNFPYNYKNRVLACFQTRPKYPNSGAKYRMVGRAPIGLQPPAIIEDSPVLGGG